ncbi:ead/Ea22-like family protein [Yersinia enterocolitica]
MNNIEELKKVALAATPGPWEKCDSYGPNENGTCISAVERPDLMIASTTGYYGRVGGIANTHFIALANPAVILDLIAQLEAAQKERDEFRLAFQQNEQAKQELFAQKDLLITANLNISRRAEKAEAELSAANEKLKGEQVPVAVIVLSKNWPDTGRKVIDYYIEKIQHLPVGTELFTAPQKPVVLSSSTVMSRAYVVQAIKAAGFTVEGE